jgi:eukaryotic-like serine/threonine-protein kinase
MPVDVPEQPRDSIVMPKTPTADGDASGLDRQSVRRLGVLTGAALAVQAISFAGVRLFDLLPSQTTAGDLGAVVAFGLLSVGVLALTRMRGIQPRLALNVGYVYQVLAALHIGMMVNRFPWPHDVWVPSWSPVAVWALVFTVAVPARPAKAALINLLTVAMDPLSLLVLIEQGKPVPTMEAALVRFSPGIGAVILGLIATKVIHGLGQQVSEARQLGSYQLVEKLGAGSFGEVWSARHRVLRRPAAVKLIGPDALGARDAKAARTVVKRFEREAQATSQLRSPHTVDLYDYGVSPDGTFFYVMELLEGLDLQRLVRRFGPLSSERVVHLLGQVCHSLHDAHVQGLVHRDIKPANLYACKNGFEYDFVKVLDFGLVKSSRQEDPGSTRLTADGTIQGTPAYIAPEMVLRDGQLDARADLYSLACVGYWLLTGELVFDEDVPMRMVLAHAKQDPMPPSDRTDVEIAPALEQIIMQCLAKDPDARPSSAWELREMLKTAEQSFERPWTQERAKDWWERELPEFTRVSRG